MEDDRRRTTAHDCADRPLAVGTLSSQASPTSAVTTDEFAYCYERRALPIQLQGDKVMFQYFALGNLLVLLVTLVVFSPNFTIRLLCLALAFVVAPVPPSVQQPRFTRDS